MSDLNTSENDYLFALHKIEAQSENKIDLPKPEYFR